MAGPVTSNAVTNGKQANETDEGSQQELEAVSLYMVQAGVFSDKANADTVTKIISE